MENKRCRLTIDLSPELRRRVRLAAAARDKSVSEYVAELLAAGIDGEAESGRRPGVLTEEAIRRMDEARERIMRGRVFPENSVDIIRKMREERTRELDRMTRHED
jgi:hypothetical protein